MSPRLEMESFPSRLRHLQSGEVSLCFVFANWAIYPPWEAFPSISHPSFQPTEILHPSLFLVEEVMGT